MFGRKSTKEKIELLDKNIMLLARAIDSIERREKYSYDHMTIPTGYGVDRVPFKVVFGEVLGRLGLKLDAQKVVFDAENTEKK